MKQWFSNMQKEIYVLGPLLPPGYGIETQNCEEGESDDIEAFLGEMQVKHGKRSVFFVRYFPSFYIPTDKKKFSDFLWNYLLSIRFGIH